MLSEKERKKVLVQFNQTDASYPRQATVISLFEDQVDRRPAAVAVEIQSRRLTYVVLEHLAEAIAGKLKACQAGRETIVALYMQPSLTMIASILGVIKAGAAYLPIDPDYPADRVRYMLENSGTRLVLTATGRPLPVGISCTIIRASEVVKQALQDFRAGMRLKRSPRQNQPQDLLYIIYTSGSTGRPKGVMIEHRNVVRLLFNDRSPFDFDADDVWTMFHSYCFDFSVWEMYGALLNGGKLILVPKMIARDPARFRRLLVDQHVTILNQTPAAFYNLIEYEMTQADHGLHLRMVIFGGDALKPPLLRPFRQAYSDVRLINMYGITETTVHVTYIELNDMDLQNSISNVGRPIPTMRVYILDKNLNPVPIGTPGEIFVSGDGVGRGYLNNPELTQARFIPNPYEPGQIMYRSGDLGRFFPLGDIEYLGRIDQQVKIRGHRIELGEIETALLEYGKIRTARVLTTENNQGNRQLIAYYVPEAPLPLAEVRQYLARQLPEYMVPAYLIALDQIPLNSNGKIAREKLPQPNQAERTDLPSAEPESDLEKQIARAFGDVLGRTQISLDDDFFRLGGDSLSAARLVAALNDAVTFADLYTAPTVRELAERMQNREVRSHTRDEWLVLNRNPAANIHLIVFPFAGGSPASFIRLSSHLAALRPEMAMYAINLPAERQPQTMLAERLAAIIQADLQGDLYFSSHCAGASLAVQTALQLERQGHSVKGLLIGASLSALPADLVRNEAGTLNPWFGLRRNLNRFLANPWRRLNDQALLRVLRDWD
jgi:fengycin family lipopeptide synthetase D